MLRNDTLRMNELLEEDIPKFLPEVMVKLLATSDENGKPNLAFIASLYAKDPKTVIFADFMWGKTNVNIDQGNHKVASAFMDLGLNFWNIPGDFTHWETSGETFEYFNNRSIFKYNAYSGISRAGFINIHHVDRQKINILKLAGSLVKSVIAKGAVKNSHEIDKLNRLTFNHFNKLLTLKYITYLQEDGYPTIIPVIALKPADKGRVYFPISPFKKEILEIPENVEIACLGLSLKIIMFQIKGKYKGIKKFRGIKLGIIDIEEVYNSLPPLTGERIA